jgi:hypothetical protein
MERVTVDDQMIKLPVTVVTIGPLVGGGAFLAADAGEGAPDHSVRRRRIEPGIAVGDGDNEGDAPRNAPAYSSHPSISTQIAVIDPVDVE